MTPAAHSHHIPRESIESTPMSKTGRSLASILALAFAISWAVGAFAKTPAGGHAAPTIAAATVTANSSSVPYDLSWGD